MDEQMQDRLRGVAVGAAIGDALGMPLEFCPPTPPESLVRDLIPGRVAAGRFTDDTEMALALAESLLAHRPLNPVDLSQRFLDWFRRNPPDIGLYTSIVLKGVQDGLTWEEAAERARQGSPSNAANGSIMRCWPVAVAWWDYRLHLIADSELQSRVTHMNEECVASSVFVNLLIFELSHGMAPAEAVQATLAAVDMPAELRAVIERAPTRRREALRNTGWVRHTLESVIWGLLTTDSFEEALIQVVNLGADADTAGSVMGAIAGAAYGLSAIPARWQAGLRGEWPLRSGIEWRCADFIQLADRLMA
ncbi:MAG: ADP-ribosylglycohydrolase family protein [Anaerolinea sp.]|nr:ADP-ribosylglycohydrolase family protein [Anaerolinea sp.]